MWNNKRHTNENSNAVCPQKNNTWKCYNNEDKVQSTESAQRPRKDRLLHKLFWRIKKSKKGIFLKIFLM